MKQILFFLIFSVYLIIGSCHEIHREPNEITERNITYFADFADYNITTKLDKSSGWYKVTSEIIIGEDAVLKLEAGTKLFFAENTGIICKGKLIAQGTKDNVIEFTADNMQIGWNNIVFKGEKTKGSILDYIQITFGKGIPLTHNSITDIKKNVYDTEEFHDHFDATQYRIGGGVLCIDSASVVFKNSLISCNSANSIGGGVCSFSSSISFDKCEFTKNFLIPIVDTKVEDPFSNSIAGSAIYCSNSNITTLKNCVVEYNNGNNEFSASHGTITCVNESEMIIDNCTISKNSIKGYEYTGGGGIWLEDSKLEVFKLSIVKNSVKGGSGGGICLLNSKISIQKCNISDNEAECAGGIMFGLIAHGARSNCVISDSNIDDNTALESGGAMLGELVSLKVENTSISENKAQKGSAGAISLVASDITFNNCIINNNTSAGIGGIEIDGQMSNSSFTKCKIEDNYGEYCGGVSLVGVSDMTFTDCSISNNISNYDCGGLHVSAAQTYFIRCTISGNKAKRNGGGLSIYNRERKAVFNKCKIIQNVAEEKGGGIYIDKTDKNVEFIDTTIEDNTPDNIYIKKDNK